MSTATPVTALDPQNAEELRLAPEVAAERAGPVHVTDAEERARIEAIGVPPAWTSVWICPLPDGHMQATGRDARDRKQYRYRPRWRDVEFRAKSGKEQRVRLSDPLLATVVRACSELPGQELFRYVDHDDRVVDVGSADVNAYLRAVTHAVFTAKDLRTWGGTRVAAEALAALGAPRSAADARRKVLAAIDAAAARLGNTRAVCRASYVCPRVPEAYVDGSLAAAFARAQDRERLSHSESAPLQVLA